MMNHFHHHPHHLHPMQHNQMHQHAMQHAQNQAMNRALRAQQQAAHIGHPAQAPEPAPPANQQNAAMNFGLLLQAVLARLIRTKP